MPGEFALVRDLRLRALRDAPAAFGTTLDEGLQQSNADWQSLAASMTGSARNAMFVARMGDEFVGSTYALVDRVEQLTGRIGGMWVDSRYRRRGVGRLMIAEVRKWAADHAMNSLRLWVPEDGTTARAFYQSVGFSVTSRRQPFPGDQERALLEMEHVLRQRF